MINQSIIVLILLLVFGCEQKESQEANSQVEQVLEEIPSPAGVGSGEANLFTDQAGKTYLSWVEQTENDNILKFSTLNGSAWSEPLEITRGSDWFVNWADFPVMVSDGNGHLAVHYLAKTGIGTFAYGVYILISNDEGVTWSDPIVPHEMETETEHGFVSMLAIPGGFQVFWLDGRETVSQNAMTIRTAFIDYDGNVNSEQSLDDRTCDCCQTSAFQTELGPVLAYRDRSEEEVRDISMVRYENEAWTAPQIVYTDNWVVRGCPVNGPSLDGDKQNLAMAWFTGANIDGKPVSKVKLVFSGDNGKTFGDAIRVDDGNPIGRVDIRMMKSGNVFVSWVEKIGKSGELRIKKYSREGKLLDTRMITSVNVARASGFPQMTLADDRLLFTWRDISNEEEPIVRTAALSIEG